MKKTLLIWFYTAPRKLITAGIICLACLSVTRADEDADFAYTSHNNAITITGYSGPGGDVIIPATIDGLPVESIGEMAFYDCTSLDRVRMPNSLISIGLEAFYGCISLTKVIIPANVRQIEGFAFTACSNLTSFTILSSKAFLNSEMFSECVNLKSIYFFGDFNAYGGFLDPDIHTNVTVYYQPQTVDWPSTVDGQPTVQLPYKYILTLDGMASFCGFGSNSDGDITIPDEAGGYPVTDIGSQVFYNCAGLTHVTIPTNATSIGVGAFFGCSGLTDMTIPGSVTSIASYAFAECTGLRNVTIGNSVISIGTGAFSGCRKLKEVSIPDSVDSIGEQAFDSCSSMDAVTSVNGLTSIGSGAFSGCSGLTDMTIADSVTNIGWWAFSDCNALTEIAIPGDVVSIGDYTFNGCCDMQNISVSADNENYSSLTGILFNKDKSVLIRHPGGKSGNYTVPSSVTAIDSEAFSGCAGLSSVMISSNVVSIGEYVFEDCASLTTIDVNPASANYCSLEGVLFDTPVTTLIQYPAGRAQNSYAVPSGVASIEACAFKECTILTEIEIPASVAEIGEHAFFNCAALTAINVDPANAIFSSAGGVLFGYGSWGETALIQYPGGKTGEYTIPGNIETIADCAFFNCTHLTSMSIPGNCASIGDHAFFNCAGLTNLTISSDVSIGNLAFANCTHLSSVAISGYLYGIGDAAFLNCSELTAIDIESSNRYMSLDGVLFNRYQTILIQCPGGKTGTFTVPESITHIADNAFFNCAELTAIDVEPDNQFYSSVDGILYDKSQTTLIQCPGGKTGGSPIPSHIAEIKDAEFSFCNTLQTGVTIPASVIRVDDYAFFQCGALPAIAVDADNPNYSSQDGVLFNKGMDCLVQYPGGKSENSYTVSADITYIGDGAFSGAANLTGLYFKGDAPDFGWASFTGSGDVSIYYLPSTEGWDQPIAGQTPLLWNPLVQSGANFGFNNNSLFGFTILGTNNMAVVVETCADLANAVWLPVSELTISNGMAEFIDTASTTHPARYYRFSMP